MIIALLARIQLNTGASENKANYLSHLLLDVKSDSKLDDIFTSAHICRWSAQTLYAAPTTYHIAESTMVAVYLAAGTLTPDTKGGGDSNQLSAISNQQSAINNINAQNTATICCSSSLIIRTFVAFKLLHHTWASNRRCVWNFSSANHNDRWWMISESSFIELQEVAESLLRGLTQIGLPLALCRAFPCLLPMRIGSRVG